ncbi:hypothetical protein G6F16_003386 [Rhizopus arrhizus]|nr:hypothetical protein G6F24_002273 [Rhizopus arrhizus]KAG0794691.1 hypothetical protein G6F21_002681 [Rhizopus arrhizus]KAG0801769.1 hypothetical protein G6F22_000919 [Rhizopus arrhizus]KAG0816558.1 hypothetical protein G6F20_003115 [Rhizopus arrhizus]KAG0837290.1 hypothetical protein G6F19_003772 [Rhizopus arrhizus]
MPPKRDQLNNTVPPHHTVQSMSFSCLPVEDMFAQYDTNRSIQDDLLLKEQQDMQSIPMEQLHQVEDSQSTNLEYQTSNSSFHDPSSSMLGYFDQTPNHHRQSLPLQEINNPFLHTSEFLYNMLDNASIASSPSLDFIPATSPPSDFYPSTAQVPPIKTQKKQKSAFHRTLSYESVMELDDNHPKPPSFPEEPLDHGKVMEALRAKLKKSASPKPRSVSAPVPPPNTYPTTGVLFLDIKNRRRKAGSSSKRSNPKST